MSPAPTSYDEIAYPSLIFWQSHPEAMAVIARLHGIDAPPVETARILHVGGGDGLDAIAMATTFPRAEVVNFDIAEAPLLRGRTWSQAAGLANVRHELIDILEAADRLEGPFDYILAHGIYAWVPEQVRAAVMPMIARLLSPKGIAFVSYDALPGGYTRTALHEMLKQRVRHLEAPSERLATARSLLREFAVPREGDQPITVAMKKDAEAALLQSEGSFYHDILNDYYAPQSLTHVVGDAARNGLQYLGEARGRGWEKGFLDPDHARMSEEALLDRLQAQDYATGRYFRSSMFIRAEVPFTRIAQHAAAQDMWVWTRATAAETNVFKTDRLGLRIPDPERAAMMHRLIASGSRMMPVAELATSPDLLGALCHYGLEGMVELRTVEPCFVTHAGDRPIASPLAGVQAAEGEKRLVTLRHDWTTLENPALGRLLLLLDGGSDRGALAREWQKLSGGDAMSLDQALQMLADKALLRA